MAIIAAFALPLIILVFVLDLLRRKKLREKYAALWLIVGFLILILAWFPYLLGVAAGLLGVQVPSNLLFAISIVFLLGVLLHLSVEISAVEDETRTLAEEVAILRVQVEKLSCAQDNGSAASADQP